MPRDAVSRTANVERTARLAFEWQHSKANPPQPMFLLGCCVLFARDIECFLFGPFYISYVSETHWLVFLNWKLYISEFMYLPIIFICIWEKLIGWTCHLFLQNYRYFFYVFFFFLYVLKRISLAGLEYFSNIYGFFFYTFLYCFYAYTRDRYSYAKLNRRVKIGLNVE